MNKLTAEQKDMLLNPAKHAADGNKCCAHSSFTVGVALLDSNGRVWNGINVENDGIQSICAERVAFCSAFASGVELRQFKAIAVVGRHLSSPKFIKTLPCGYCRQFMSEYAASDMPVITIDGEYTVGELLPESFSL